MSRSLLVVLLVAGISAWIARSEREAEATHSAEFAASAPEWIRTADGWEPRRVLAARRPIAPPPVHPAVIASLQLVASLLVLVAFPTRVTVLAPQPAATPKCKKSRNSREPQLAVA